MKVVSVFNPSDGDGRKNEVKINNWSLYEALNIPNFAIKFQSKHLAFKKTVSEYVQNSTIHGLAYVGDIQRNKFER